MHSSDKQGRSSDEQVSLLSTVDSTYGATIPDDDDENEDNPLIHDDATEAPSILTSLADNVSEVIHDGLDVITEVAGEVQHAVVEVVEHVEHVVIDIGEELQMTVVEILAPETEEEVQAEDEGMCGVRWLQCVW